MRSWPILKRCIFDIGNYRRPDYQHLRHLPRRDDRPLVVGEFAAGVRYVPRPTGNIKHGVGLKRNNDAVKRYNGE
jgi:hypothetical protein